MRRHVFALIVITALLLGACGPAVAPPTGEATESGERFQIALPRLVVDVNSDGSLSAFGFDLARLPLIGASFQNLKLNPFYGEWAKAANVQHVELRQAGDGLALLVNGQQLPYIGWDDASLSQATDLAGMFGIQGLDQIQRFLPIIRRLGLNLVLRFPQADGRAAIPLYDGSAALAKPAPDNDPSTAVAHMEVKYDDQGVPSILGISARDLAAMGINLPLAMSPQLMQQMQAQNIQYMELRTKPDGLYVYVNGQGLPHLVWDNQLLTNVSELYAATNPTSPYNDFIKLMAPAIDNLDISLLLHFPKAAGVEALPIETH